MVKESYTLLNFVMLTKSRGSAVRDHKSRVQASLIDEERRQLAERGIAETFNAPLADGGQLMHPDCQIVKSLRMEEENEQRCYRTFLLNKCYCGEIKYLCWIFSMEVSTRYGLTSFCKHHLTQSQGQKYRSEEEAGVVTALTTFPFSGKVSGKHFQLAI